MSKHEQYWKSPNLSTFHFYLLSYLLIQNTAYSKIQGLTVIQSVKRREDWTFFRGFQHSSESDQEVVCREGFLTMPILLYQSGITL